VTLASFKIFRLNVENVIDWFSCWLETLKKGGDFFYEFQMTTEWRIWWKRWTHVRHIPIPCRGFLTHQLTTPLSHSEFAGHHIMLYVIQCTRGCVVVCQTCDHEVAGTHLTLGYCVFKCTVPSRSINEYQRKLRSQLAYLALHWPLSVVLQLRLKAIERDQSHSMGP